MRRSEEVSRQIETRERRLERAGPEREQIGERGLGEGASLSSSEIAELKRERGKRGREAAGEAVIKGGEVVEEDVKRGGIGDDVMRRDEQEVEGGVELEEEETDERRAREVEVKASERRGEREGGGASERRRKRREVEERERRERERGEELRGRVRGGGGEGERGSEDGVTQEDVVERGGKASRIERAGEKQGGRDVESRRERIEEVKQEEALLSVGYLARLELAAFRNALKGRQGYTRLL